MINEIEIENLGVISHTRLEFAAGLTVITGETGAGKTMVLNSLNLLAGKKPDVDLVRHGEKACRITGIYGTENNSPLEAIVEAAGGQIEEGELICTRRVPREGRSRASVGGAAVPASVLANISDSLLTIHGQSDQVYLKSGARQLAMIDSYGGKEHLELVKKYAESYRELQRLEKELAEWEAQALVREIEIRDLQAGLEKIAELAPQVGEEEELITSIDKLSQIDNLREHIGTAVAIISGESQASVQAGLGMVSQAVEKASRGDKELAVHLETIRQASYLLADLGGELESYLYSLEAEEGDLEYCQNRLSQLRHYCIKWASNVDEWIEWGESAKDRLMLLEGPNNHGQELQKQIERQRESAQLLAEEISGQRLRFGKELESQVNQELVALAMNSVRFLIQIQTTENMEKNGIDRVVFGLSNENSDSFRGLSQGASGGELSRIMLALEVCLAKKWKLPGQTQLTYIFDEIDAGIGGQTALAVGARLSELAKTTQVIVVTHLAQVAAWGDRQLVVKRKNNETEVVAVSGEARAKEIARMLSGKIDSESAVTHAKELLSSCSMG